jgi:hypothetical protein
VFVCHYAEKAEVKAMIDSKNAQLLTIVSHVAKKYGCTMKDIDMDKKILNIEGPAKAKYDGAIALADILG